MENTKFDYCAYYYFYLCEPAVFQIGNWEMKRGQGADLVSIPTYFYKVHIFWEGHKNFVKSPPFFDWYTSQKKVEISQTFCGLLRIYELYVKLPRIYSSNPVYSCLILFRLVWKLSEPNVMTLVHMSVIWATN